MPNSPAIITFHPDQLQNQIILWDCYRVLKQIPADTVDLVVSDPPYEFVSKTPQGWGFMTHEKTKHFESINDSFGMTFDPDKYLKGCRRILKKFNGYFFTNKNLLMKYIAFAEKHGYKWDLLIWIKPNPVPCFNGHFMTDKEYCIFIREKGSCFNSKEDYKNYFTYFEEYAGGKKKLHPTIKPLEFIEKMIRVSSREGDLVFDGFAGSGTTGVACKNLGMDYVLIEQNKEYVDLIHQRIGIEDERAGEDENNGEGEDVKDEEPKQV